MQIADSGNPSAAVSWAAERQAVTQLNQRFLVAHHIYIDAEGLPYPMSLTGYLTDAQRPLGVLGRFLGATEERPMTRMAMASPELRPTHMPPECAEIEYVSCLNPEAPFNLPASLVSVLHGRTYFPLHGLVAAVLAPDDTGVRRKLKVAHKQRIDETLAIVNTVLFDLPGTEDLRPEAVATVRWMAEAIRKCEKMYQEGVLDFDPHDGSSRT